jgi:hypothetical protein
MFRTVALLTAVWVFACPLSVPAGPKEDVGVATQAWMDAMNSHDTDRVVAL